LCAFLACSTSSDCHRSAVLAVKIEVDTNPPAGAVLTTTIVRRHLTLQIQHHDRASLLAGKLHALLQRPYVKGRDLYDLLWYLSDPGWPPPNLVLLNNALRQTGWPEGEVTSANWRSLVAGRLSNVSRRDVAADLAPFLDPQTDPDHVTQDYLLKLLERRAP
jgi:hypothetical protein